MAANNPLLSEISEVLKSRKLVVKPKYKSFTIGTDLFKLSDSPIPYLYTVLGVDLMSPERAHLGIPWIVDKNAFIDDMLTLASEARFELKDIPFQLAHAATDSLFVHRANHGTGLLVLDNDTLLPSSQSVPALRSHVGGDYFNEVLVPQAPVIRHVFDSISQPYWHTREHPKHPQIMDVNAYIPPSIYTHTSLRSAYKIDIKPINAFLRYIFPDKDQRQWVLGWMAHAVTTRAKVFLCLVGREATGKTTFANLMKRLICGFDEYSQSYFFRGQKNFGKTQFTGHLEGKRLLFLDEFRLRDRDHLDTFKDIIEDDVNRESKFKEEKTIQNTVSIIMANNWDNSLFIHPATGRKFSVPDIAEKKMVEVFSQSQIDEIQAAIEEPDVIARLYRILTERYLDAYDPSNPIHSATYERVTRASAYSFVTAILKDEIDEAKKPGAVWDVTELAVDYMPNANGRVGWTEARVIAEIVEFFQSFRWGQELACEVFYKRGKPWLRLTDSYFEFLAERRQNQEVEV